MVRLAVVLDRDLGVGANTVAAVWDADDEARHLGQAKVESAGGGIFSPGVVELVAIPLTVNLASGALYDLLRPLTTKSSRSPRSNASGDRVVVVRSRRQHP